jgi:hypothetical protein
MKRALVLIIVLLAVVGIGCLSRLFALNSGPRLMEVHVTGPAGVRVSVRIEADGYSRTEDRAVPCTIQATACKLIFVVTRLDGPVGEIRVTMSADGRLHGVNSGLKEVHGHLEFSGHTQKVASIGGR